MPPSSIAELLQQLPVCYGGGVCSSAASAEACLQPGAGSSWQARDLQLGTHGWISMCVHMRTGPPASCLEDFAGVVLPLAWEWLKNVVIGMVQEQAASLLGTAGNILGRLEALQQPSLYGPLEEDEEVQALVLGKQLQAFDAALSAVHDALAGLAAAVRDLERPAMEAARQMQTSSRGASSWAAALECRGAEPSPAQCCEVLQDAWMMCRDEFLLQQAVVALVGYGTKPQDMEALLSCFKGQPNVDVARISLFFHQVAQVASARQR